MTFEEKFPNIKRFMWNEDEIEYLDISSLAFSNGATATFPMPDDVVLLSEVEEHCLDKQKVREAIDKLPKEIAGTEIKFIDAEKLKKELGL
jgi:hypothetical protein